MYKDTPLSPPADDNNANKFYTSPRHCLDGVTCPYPFSNHQPPSIGSGDELSSPLPSPDLGNY